LETLNVDGLPAPVIHNLRMLVDALKEQSAVALPPGEGLKQAAGAWADADDAAFAQWAEEMRRGRSDGSRSIEP
jgi:hypothetical protein